ncbi:MAG: YncE family protein [Bacteroidota bacterium]|nr:YncE family protein [Bacteroidota bacterium]
MRRFPALLTLLLAAVSSDLQAQSRSPVFSRDILPVLQESFAPLLERESGLELDSWQALMAGSDYGQVVIPYDASSSLLMRLSTELDPSDPLSAQAAAIDPAELALVREWIQQGAPNDEGIVAFADATNLLYACIEDAATVVVIDMDANMIIRTIDLQSLGFTADAKPHHVAVEPDGSAFYVSLIGDDVILKFNRRNELIGQTSFERPGMVQLHQNQDLLFVGRSMKAVNPPQRIGRLVRSTMELEELDVFFPRPHALTIHPDGQYVYVGSLAENRFATLDHEAENLELQSLEGDTHTLVQFAISPDGRTMVVGGQLTGLLLIFDISEPSAPQLTHQIKVGAAPWHPVFTPDGAQVWFGNKMANTATVVDMEARQVAAVIEGLAQPHGAAVSPDGRFVYLSNNNLNGAYQSRYTWRGETLPGAIAVIDAESQAVLRMLEVGPNPTGLGTK